MSESLQINLKRRSHSYRIHIGSGLLQKSGKFVKASVSPACKNIAVISNKKVFGLYGEAVCESLRDSGFKVFVWLMPDGEKFKNITYFGRALDFFGKSRLKRSDAVIALGGGVVGDLTGFAAASYLRGIAYLQIPTTLLSQIDSSVGGKTAINTSFGKNTAGAFYQPNAVLIDIWTLKTLPQRELTAGFCEAIKHGAISGKRLFSQTKDFLACYGTGAFKNNFENKIFLNELTKLISAQIEFKAKIVSGDESESINQKSSKSRKILNFGHTIAHALEKATDYKYFKHGEAVGYGMLAAATLSKNIGILEKNIVTLLNDVLSLAGKLPGTNNIAAKEIFDLLVFDKKNVGESLQWILLEDLGKPKIVSGGELKDSVVLDSISSVLHTR